MGKHQKDIGRKVIDFISELGTTFGYVVNQEEYMFPGKANSPVLDITWRRSAKEKQPLFIFEVKSLPTKSAPDNVMKVFSRDTVVFRKPLFFFHVFVDSPQNTDRIEYLRENYGKANYGVFLFDSEEHQLELIWTVLEQHLIISANIPIYSMMIQVLNSPILNIDCGNILSRFVDAELDLSKNTNFLVVLEKLLLANYNQALKEFYRSYLHRALTSKEIPSPIYHQPLYVTAYAHLIHYALEGLMQTDIDLKNLFEALVTFEKTWEPIDLWYPAFGLSRDHDMLLIREFPLLLTMLCTVFFSTTYASYFSQKLKNILSHVKIIDSMSQCSFIWLLFAAKISQDKDSYNYARERLNADGGVSLTAIKQPYHIVTANENSSPLIGKALYVPDYQRWNEWIGVLEAPTEHSNVELSIIGSFLITYNWEKYRTSFAFFCLEKSLQ